MDVAARNCLIDEGNVVKLADFGLTRQLDPGTNRYLLKKTAKLPVRWVALEALETGVFSQASDVWAFGVLMWEVLSYGELPYVDVGNVDVQKRVKGGLRLKCPPNANADLFDIAQSCWKLPKKMRPLFSPLDDRLKGLIDEAKELSVPERDVGLACQEDH
jgi:serine/threonine protein kinase